MASYSSCGASFLFLTHERASLVFLTHERSSLGLTFTVFFGRRFPTTPRLRASLVFLTHERSSLGFTITAFFGRRSPIFRGLFLFFEMVGVSMAHYDHKCSKPTRNYCIKICRTLVHVMLCTTYACVCRVRIKCICNSASVGWSFVSLSVRVRVRVLTCT